MGSGSVSPHIPGIWVGFWDTLNSPNPGNSLIPIKKKKMDLGLEFWAIPRFLVVFGVGILENSQIFLVTFGVGILSSSQIFWKLFTEPQQNKG